MTQLRHGLAILWTVLLLAVHAGLALPSGAVLAAERGLPQVQTSSVSHHLSQAMPSVLAERAHPSFPMDLPKIAHLGTRDYAADTGLAPQKRLVVARPALGFWACAPPAMA